MYNLSATVSGCGKDVNVNPAFIPGDRGDVICRTTKTKGLVGK